MISPFEIRILNQRWIPEDAASTDLCSHGSIFIGVNGTVLSDDQDGDWGISETALALLRSVKYGHPHKIPSFARWRREYRCKMREDYLVYHGCGAMLMMGCPIHITWNAYHKDGDVVLSGFRKCPVGNEKYCISFEGLKLTLPLTEYARAVYRFAFEAKQFFVGVEKDYLHCEEYEGEYEDFWMDYDDLLLYASGQAR